MTRPSKRHNDKLLTLRNARSEIVTGIYRHIPRCAYFNLEYQWQGETIIARFARDEFELTA